MSATPGRYSPTHVDERLVEPVNACRVVTLIHLADIASLGEAVTRPNGRRISKRGYKSLLTRMRNATGEPARPSYNQGHIDTLMQAGFKGYPRVVPFNEPFERIRESVQDGFAISLAGQAGADPATGHPGVPQGSPLAQFTRVEHQILIVRERQRDGQTEWLIYDPMVPWNPRHRGYWAPAEHVRIFGKRFASAGGDYIAERVKIGSWTKLARFRTERDAQVASLKKRARDAERERDQARADLAACQAELGGP
jgi:hypothetical protein